MMLRSIHARNLTIRSCAMGWRAIALLWPPFVARNGIESALLMDISGLVL